MDTHSFAVSSRSHAPDRLHRDEIDSTLPVVVAELRAVMMMPSDYCSYYLHCYCSACRQLMCWLSTKMAHIRPTLIPLSILWKRWAMCWAEMDSTLMHRQAIAMAIVRSASSSCSIESSRSNSSCPLHPSPRSDIRDCRQLLTRKCFPCRASPGLSSHGPRVLSNRRCRCVSKKGEIWVTWHFDDWQSTFTLGVLSSEWNSSI